MTNVYKKNHICRFNINRIATFIVAARNPSALLLESKRPPLNLHPFGAKSISFLQEREIKYAVFLVSFRSVLSLCFSVKTFFCNSPFICFFRSNLLRANGG